MLSKVFALALGATVCAAFPVTEVVLTTNELDFFMSNASSLAAKAKVATEKLLPGFRIFFNKSANAVQVDVGDINVTENEPSSEVDSSCSHKIYAKNPKGTATITNDTYLQFGVNSFAWKNVSVFAEGAVAAALDIDSDIEVKVGKKVFGKCQKIAQKTVNVDVKSTGVNALGLNMSATNPTIEKINNTRYLVFDFHASVVTLVLSWDVDDVTVHGCKIEILGIKIGSYCGLLENIIKSGVTKLTTEVQQVIAPNIQQKLEKIINTAIGSTIKIPIKLSD